MLHAIVMAGGAGTRFWPASRVDLPKQLLAMSGKDSMIQATVSRLGKMCPPENVRVITNQRLVNQIQAQLPSLPSEAIVGEPCKRDTAPCVGLAAALVAAADPEGVMVVMPSDHVISPDEKFQEAIEYAHQLVLEDPDRILTFGIKPTYPATVFGYIESGEKISSANAQGDQTPPTFEVSRFREKPDLATAEEFIANGSFYWNAGIFVWRAKTILDALRRFEPKMASHIDSIASSIGKPDFEETLSREFAAIEGTSIDFAVMEKYKPVCVIESQFVWNDVGNWTSLEGLVGQDSDGNTLIGDHLAIDCKNTIIRNDNRDGHIVATIGMQDCIVIRTPDATLVVEKKNEADVKKVVEALKEKGLDQYL